MSGWPALLLLAAGASRRMGERDKLLEAVAGEALLTRQARMGLEAGLDVIVTLAPEAPARDRALARIAPGGPTHPPGRRARSGRLVPVRVPDAAEGMGASIRAGIAALGPEVPGVMILPADMPEIRAADLSTLAADFMRAPDAVLRATAADGTPGHPVIFPRRLFPALSGLSGDAGARGVLRGEEVRLHALPGRRALTDLDTPEDWAAWRDGRG